MENNNTWILVPRPKDNNVLELNGCFRINWMKKVKLLGIKKDLFVRVILRWKVLILRRILLW